MPTKKPAQAERRRVKRTDWKARAKHCEEVIGVQNQIAKFREQKLAETTDSFRLEQSRATFYETQCEAAAKARIEAVDKLAAAEKHNAILLAEREARDKREVTCDVCGADTGGELNSNYCDECWDRELHQSLRQRFKAWAAKWSIEIACALTILAVFAGASWYALRWGK